MDFSETSLLSDDIWLTQGPRLTFSHSGEDRFLSILFQNRTVGFYVDFGCFHPSIYSNTFLLHQRGWAGLNLDANPDAIKSMKLARPNDINIQMAVAEEAGTTQLAYFGEFASSNTTSAAFAKEISEKQNVSIQKFIDVECNTTKEILDKYIPDGKVIDYWNIDIEGFDVVALKTNDWKKYRPSVISVEDFSFILNHPDRSETHRLLTDLGYSPASRYLYTTFYVDPASANNLNGVPRL
jgi:hypothetical protein